MSALSDFLKKLSRRKKYIEELGDIDEPKRKTDKYAGIVPEKKPKSKYDVED